MISRRDFLKLSGAGVLSLYAVSRGKFALKAQAQIPGGTLAEKSHRRLVWIEEGLQGTFRHVRSSIDGSLGAGRSGA